MLLLVDQEQVPSSVVSYKGTNAYNNFDTNAAYYVNSLIIQSPEDAKNTVMQYSGRVERRFEMDL
jgi:pectate lyase